MNSLERIIDGLDLNYIPISDEECSTDSEEVGSYYRVFRHKDGNEFIISWDVFYGTPETVLTVFTGVEKINAT